MRVWFNTRVSGSRVLTRRRGPSIALKTDIGAMLRVLIDCQGEKRGIFDVSGEQCSTKTPLANKTIESEWTSYGTRTCTNTKRSA